MPEREYAVEIRLAGPLSNGIEARDGEEQPRAGGVMGPLQMLPGKANVEWEGGGAVDAR
jgi:hypothetical protein